MLHVPCVADVEAAYTLRGEMCPPSPRVDINKKKAKKCFFLIDLLVCKYFSCESERKDVKAHAIQYWMRCVASGFCKNLERIARKHWKKNKGTFDMCQWISKRMFRMTALCFWVSAKVVAVEIPSLQWMAALPLAFGDDEPNDFEPLFANEEKVKEGELKLLKVLQFDLNKVFLPRPPKSTREDPCNLRKLLHTLVEESTSLLSCSNHFQRNDAVRRVFNAIASTHADIEGTNLEEKVKNRLEKHLKSRKTTWLSRRFPDVDQDPRIKLFLHQRMSV